MGNLNISMSTMFSTIRVPPPLHDPTGGLLEPILGPIGFVVQHIEEVILSAMRDGVVGIQSLLRDATGELSGNVNNIITSLMGSAQNGLTSITAAIQSMVSDADELASATINLVFGLLGEIENLISAAVNRISQLAINVLAVASSDLSDAKTIINSLASRTGSSINNLVNRGFSELTGEIVRLIDEFQATCDGAVSNIGRITNDAVTGTAGVIDGFLASGRSDVSNTFGKIRSDANSALAYARDAKNRIYTTGSAIENQIGSGVRDIEVDISIESARAKSTLSSGMSYFPYIIGIGLVVVGIAGIVLLAIKYTDTASSISKNFHRPKKAATDLRVARQNWTQKF